MNLILLTPEDLRNSGASAIVRGTAHRHIQATLRAKVGDELRIGCLGGNRGTARVGEISSEALHLVDLQLNVAPPAPLDLHLYIAMPRPKLLPRVLLAATSLGIKQITLFNALRVEKAYWSSEQVKPAAIEAACRLGLEQARDTILPDVRIEKLFKPFVEDRWPALIKGRRALLAHPHAEMLCPFQLPDPVSLAIGPEGGFIQYELDQLARAGFEMVRTYERILRVETALSSLVGRLK